MGSSFRERVRETATAALEARAVGDARWDELLRSLRLEPATEEQRRALLKDTPLRRGVLPIELRRALDAIRHETLRNLPSPPDAGLEAELAATVARAMEDYLRQVKPAPLLGGIFANAQATTIRQGDLEDGVRTKKCEACGAARPEGTDLRTCQFCGGDLFASAAT